MAKPLAAYFIYLDNKEFYTILTYSLLHFIYLDNKIFYPILTYSLLHFIYLGNKIFYPILTYSLLHFPSHAVLIHNFFFSTSRFP